MNTTHPTPPPSPAHRPLAAHALAIDAAGLALGLARTVPPALRAVADQLIRSAVSVPANLAEGAGRVGRDRLHHWRIAYASALEADIHLRLLVAAGAVNAARAENALALFDRVRAMTWRLLHPAR